MEDSKIKEHGTDVHSLKMYAQIFHCLNRPNFDGKIFQINSTSFWTLRARPLCGHDLSNFWFVQKGCVYFWTTLYQ